MAMFYAAPARYGEVVVVRVRPPRHTLGEPAAYALAQRSREACFSPRFTAASAPFHIVAAHPGCLRQCSAERTAYQFSSAASERSAACRRHERCRDARCRRFCAAATPSAVAHTSVARPAKAFWEAR